MTGRIVLQLVLYCLLFIGLVKCAVRNSGRNCLYFYPKEYLEEAQRRGIVDKDAVMKSGKRFMIPFCSVIFAALILVIAVWNRVTDFRTAYLQAYLFLVVMNWFDGIVLDRIWVEKSRIWKVEGMEGIPYIKPWRTVLIRRGLATILYLPIARVIAGIAVWIGRAV